MKGLGNCNDTENGDVVCYIVNKFNELCGESLPSVKLITPARRDNIKRRLAEVGAEELIGAFEKVAGSDFLRGDNSRRWRADFDWIIKPANLVKVLEGNYDNKGAPKIKKGSFDTDEFFAAALAKSAARMNAPSVKR